MNWAVSVKRGSDDEELAYLRRLVRDRAGITMDEERAQLVRPRLERLATKLGCRDLGELVGRLKKGRDVREVVSAMTTNETSFFRDQHPFELLREHLLPELLRLGRTARIWSAACSTGQELYSIAMVADAHAPTLRLELVGTDICGRALEQAREGRYSNFEVRRGLPDDLKAQYLRQQDGQWQVTDRIRRRVRFERANLLDAAPVSGVDVLLLRNVLIYFDDGVRRRVLRHAKRAMHPDGYLMVGGCENITGLDPELQPTRMGRTTCYRIRR